MDADSKQSSLTGAYYGPAIPPQRVDHNRRCNAAKLEFKPYSLLCMAFKTFTIILILVGIVAVISWLVFMPQDLKVYVENTSLARFNLSADNRTLYYNLTVEMSVRNPNKKLGLEYKRVEANALYAGSRFGFQEFPNLQQNHKSTMILRPTFRGQAAVVGELPSIFNREKGEGFFYIGVKLYTRIRLKMMMFYSVEYGPEVDCYLRIPAPGNATSAAGRYARTRCNAESFN